MSKRLGCVVFLCALVVTLRSPGRADLSPAPISVSSCTVVPETISRRGTLPETIRVTFSVMQDTAADVARFTATAPAGAYRDFTLHGTFSKGVTIADRVIAADPNLSAHALAPGVECMLTYVHFVNGASWTAPGT